VAPGQTQTVTVGFSPLSPGGANGNVSFSSNGGASTNALSGVGLTPGNLVVNPITLDFGTLPTSVTSQQIFQVTNNGGTTVSNGTAVVNGGPYTILSANTFSLTPGSSTNVTVRFAPVSAGGFTNIVIIGSANGGSSTNIVTGTGAVVPVA